MTATPLATPGFPSSPSRERGDSNDQDYLREDDGRTTYNKTTVQGYSRQLNGNTAYIFNGLSNVYHM
jgi:hypothetical protein